MGHGGKSSCSLETCLSKGYWDTSPSSSSLCSLPAHKVYHELPTLIHCLPTGPEAVSPVDPGLKPLKLKPSSLSKVIVSGTSLQ